MSNPQRPAQSSWDSISTQPQTAQHRAAVFGRQNDLSPQPGPVVIGGVGGSGTRLIAQCLKEAGFYIGGDLNNANDNLWFTLLFKQPEILAASDEDFDNLLEIFLAAMRGNTPCAPQQTALIEALASKKRPQHPQQWLKKRVETILAIKASDNNASERRQSSKWGWKEPNSHLVLDRLIDRIEHIRYIHVARNGLDMAHSKNQNQLKLWGKHFLGEAFDVTPYYSLKYWCVVHDRVMRIGQSMGENFLFLNFDQLCADPESGITQLLKFIGKEVEPLKTRLMALVEQPDSIGRFTQYGTDIFSQEDVAFVESLGFDVRVG